MQLTKDVLPERSWYHHPGPIHDELIGDPKVVADCKKWTERIIDPAFVRWKAVLNRFPKLSVVRVPVGFLLEPCNVRVLQEGVDLVTRSGVLVEPGAASRGCLLGSGGRLLHQSRLGRRLGSGRNSQRHCGRCPAARLL